MASPQSSQDMWRGRGRQPERLGNAQPRHRSESRRLSDRWRPVKTVARKRDHRPGALDEGDAVRVFSRSADKWVDGEVVKLVEGNHVRVEYAVDEHWSGKMMHVHSDHLFIPSTMSVVCQNSSSDSEEEHDPGYHFPCMYNQAAQDNDSQAARQALRALEILAKEGSVKACVELQNMSFSTDSSKEARQVVERLQTEALFKLPPPPSFLAQQSTGLMIELQRTNPIKWAMRFKDWKKFIDECRNGPTASKLFREIKNAKMAFERYVSIYDINDYFVIPWTRGKGVGIALLMETKGLTAEIMISHAWGEDVEELYEALDRYFSSHRIHEDTPVWFCTFAQYQPEDGEGPSIKEQLECVPETTSFKCVVQSPAVQNMVAVHTSKADLYGRLWCVHEVDEALALKVEGKKKDLKIDAAMSKEYKDEVTEQYMLVVDARGGHDDAMQAAGLTVHTARASCSRADKKMLIEQVLARPGGFARIDKHVTKFRQESTQDIILKHLRERQMQRLEADQSDDSICEKKRHWHELGNGHRW